MSLYAAPLERAGFTPYIGGYPDSITDIHIGGGSGPSFLPAGDAVSFSSRSMEMSGSYVGLQQSGLNLDGLRYSATAQSAAFSFSMSAFDLRADFAGNVSFSGETIKINMTVNVEELYLAGGADKESNGKGIGNAYGHERGGSIGMRHVKLTYELDRTQYEGIFAGLNEKPQSPVDERLFKLLRTLAGISLKDEKKSILILFADEKAVGVLANKTGRKVMELVLFIVIASHLNATERKGHYNIWLHGGWEEKAAVLASFTEKVRCEMDLYIGSGERAAELPGGT